MLLKNGDSYFSFVILDYQFPQITKSINNDPFDANWLIVQIKYSDDGIHEENYTDSCILTFEWNEIISQIKKIYNGKSVCYSSEFIESYFNIEVEYQKIGYHLTCSFVTNTTREKWETISLSAMLSRKQLLNCIIDLEKEIYNYSER